MAAVKNIIFDLGGVILDIDFGLTHRAFEKAGVKGFDKLYSQHAASPFFVEFEKGKIETPLFFDHIREICGCPLTDEVIRDCWNAMLIGFDPAKLDRLQEIARRYPSYLFSNTNIIHYQCFSKMYYSLAGKEFNASFIKAYYSHEMGLRKPDADSFRHLLDEQSLDPAETLFIDDTIKNVEAAKNLGLQALLLQPPETIIGLRL